MKYIYKNFCTYSQSRYSISRILQNSCIKEELFWGKVLDAGGVKGVEKGAQNFATGYDTWEYLNFDPDTKPDYIADLNNVLPFEDNVYDIVVCMNTLEHIYNINIALREFFRLLKDGGKLVVAVPFIFGIHGAPDDFHRPTGSCWEQMLLNAGFMRENIKVTPLYIDKWTSILSLLDNSLGRTYRFILRNTFFIPTLLGLTNKTNNLPLSYYICACK